MTRRPKTPFAAGIVLLAQISCNFTHVEPQHAEALADSLTKTWFLDDYSISKSPERNSHNQKLWPVAAIVNPSRLRGDSPSTLPAATFFLLASPDMSALKNWRVNMDYVRFADKCRAVELRGHWIRFSKDEAPFFLLAYDCGGTAGDALEIFAHEIALADPSVPDSYQCHSFRRVFTGYSRVPPLLADVNQDGAVELVIGTSETNGTAIDTATSLYQVLEWNQLEGAFQESMVVPINVLRTQISDLTKI